MAINFSVSLLVENVDEKGEVVNGGVWATGASYSPPVKRKVFAEPALVKTKGWDAERSVGQVEHSTIS